MRAQIECAYTVKERFKFRQVADFQSRAVPVGVGPASAFRIIKGFPRRRNMPGLTFFDQSGEDRGPSFDIKHVATEKPVGVIDVLTSAPVADYQLKHRAVFLAMRSVMRYAGRRLRLRVPP
ncbi:hypothetical protein HPO_04405 [Hyphomonas polymorpha PS728]|uniref:Uncharacterized protein n=1 Tax=Hyphomonas polymorpha PS728 TaxID=1280954 RepID=A0A062VLR3_9PROT|nr:hypothetical protein HPO_04405 [Hyphomonas polymorpha PS728]